MRVYACFCYYIDGCIRNPYQVNSKPTSRRGSHLSLTGDYSEMNMEVNTTQSRIQPIHNEGRIVDSSSSYIPKRNISCFFLCSNSHYFCRRWGVKTTVGFQSWSYSILSLVLTSEATFSIFMLLLHFHCYCLVHIKSPKNAQISYDSSRCESMR